VNHAGAASEERTQAEPSDRTQRSIVSRQEEAHAKLASPRPDLAGLRIDRTQPKVTGRWARIAAWAAVGAAALAVAAWVHGRNSRAPASRAGNATGAPSAAAPTGQAEGGTVLNANGYVAARRKARVAAETTGRVVDMSAEEGMLVQAGQVLARLDPSEPEAQLEVALSQGAVASASTTEAALSVARAERAARRTRMLSERAVATPEQLDDALTRV
jgi:multidrug efflux pump subunit AcrA (membrane-fusion protein)